MSTTTDFIAELVRAANEVHLLSPAERRRLLERAAAVIAAQREILDLRDKVVPPIRGVVSDLDAMKQHAREGRMSLCGRCCCYAPRRSAGCGYWLGS